MKKNIIRIIALVLAILMLIGIVGSSLMSVFASSESEKIFAHGSGLTEAEIEITGQLLGVDSAATKLKITGADAEKYINEPSNDIDMISSVYIVKNGTGKINVDVVTPLSIKEVTALQYSNAAVTAGLESVDIKVGAVKSVTGTSALTGVYKALESLGVSVDEKRTDVANKEVLIVNEIEDNNKNNPEFTKEKLNKIILEVKEKLVEEKQKDGEVSKDKVNDITQTVIKDNNFNTLINNIDIEKLNVIFNNFINIENLNLETTKAQIQDLLGSAQNVAEKEYENLQKYIQTNEGKKYLESIKDKFSQEQFDSLISGAKDKLNSKEMEDAINKVKDSIDTSKLNDLLNSAKDKLGISQETLDNARNKAGGTFDAIMKFFKSIFKAIGDVFRNIF